jgi:hypothetical protein
MPLSLRHLMLALLIVLLPLRGWMGDAMALEMLSQTLNTSKSIATAPDSAWATSHFDQSIPHTSAPCHDEADSGADTAALSVPGESCHHCNACEVCNLTAAMQTTALAALVPVAQQAVAAHGWRFASASTRSHLKPPIIQV